MFHAAFIESFFILFTHTLLGHQPPVFDRSTPESQAWNLDHYPEFFNYLGANILPEVHTSKWEPDYDLDHEEGSPSQNPEQHRLRKRILADFKRAGILSDFRRRK